METLQCVFQYPFARLQNESFPLRGKWNQEYFHNSNPIVLELGCGKGEYAVGLASRFPDKNYIGIDCKGARMWTGATQATAMGLSNVAFLRTDIELINSFFAENEVSEIWITFPDPQMKKVNKRLTGTRFLALYRRVCIDGAEVCLKTDSPFLYAYTGAMVRLNNLDIIADTPDLYGGDMADDPILNIHTHYENQWIARGLTIKYLVFALRHDGDLLEPEDDFERDTYRSYSRGIIQQGLPEPPAQSVNNL